MVRSFAVITDIVALLFILHLPALAQQPSWLNLTNGDYVTCVQVQDDTVWVGTYGGLVKIVRSTGQKTFYNVANSSISYNRVDCLLLSASGALWIGTHNGGVAAYDQGTWTLHDSTNDEAMPARWYSFLVEDRSGGVWSCARDSGLNCYRQLTRTVHGLPGNVQCCIADRDSGLWVGTSKGLQRFSGSKWSSFAVADSPSLSIDALFQDRDGRLWAKVSGGIAEYDGRSWHSFNKTLSPALDGNSSSILEDKGGNLWIATTAGVAAFNGTTWNTVFQPQLYTSGHIKPVLFEDTKGDIWFSILLDSLRRYHAGTLTAYTTDSSGFPSNRILCIASDSSGDIWAGTDKGLGVYHAENWTRQGTSNSALPSNYVHSLIVQKSGRVMIGTSEGIALFDNGKWETWTTKNSGLPSDNVAALLEDDSGKIWIGTDNGLARFDGMGWVVYDSSATGLATDFIPNLAQDGQGGIWAGADGGAWYGAGGMARFYHGSWAPLSDSTILCYYPLTVDAPECLLRDRSGVLWVGIWRGAAWFDGQTWNTYTQGCDPVWSLTQDSTGLIWAGTYGFSYTYDGATWGSRSIPPQIYAPSILFTDKQGNVWAVGGGNLAKFDGNNWTIYNRGNSGVPSGWMYCMAQDKLGNMWIGTNNGIAVYGANLPSRASYPKSLRADNKGWLKVLYRGGPSGEMVLRFGVERSGPVRLALYSLDGRIVHTFVNEAMRIGTYSLTWDKGTSWSRALPKGIYVVHYATQGVSASQRILLGR